MAKQKTLRTVCEVVKAFGGPKALAQWADVGPSAVSNWKADGFIPPGWHYRMMLELQGRGFSVAPQAFGVDPEMRGPYKARRVA